MVVMVVAVVMVVMVVMVAVVVITVVVVVITVVVVVVVVVVTVVVVVRGVGNVVPFPVNHLQRDGEPLEHLVAARLGLDEIGVGLQEVEQPRLELRPAPRH